MEKLIPGGAANEIPTPIKTPIGKPEPPKMSPDKSKPTFGLLKEVPIDEVWSADGDFADWFTDNVKMLDAALGMTFMDVQKFGKGDFTATAGKKTVLIETQLTQTNNQTSGDCLSTRRNTPPMSLYGLSQMPEVSIKRLCGG